MRRRDEENEDYKRVENKERRGEREEEREKRREREEEEWKSFALESCLVEFRDYFITG